MNLHRILHAGYVLQKDQVQIAFDPLFENPFSRNCYAYPAVHFDRSEIAKLNWDAIFISHFHDDHCSLESLNLLNRRIPIYLFCQYQELFSMIRDLGFENVYPLQIGETIQIADFKVTVHRALDADVDSIFQIQCGDLQILNVVDSWIDDEVFENLKKIKWDLVLWPFQTMLELQVLQPHRMTVADQEIPIEWKNQIQQLNPKNLIPSSCQFIHEEWSWYRWAYFPISYRGFTEQIKKILPETEVVRLDPSMGIEFSNTSFNFIKPLKWVERLSQESVDYDYNIDLPFPSTSEIAQKFPPLTSLQLKRLERFFDVEILQQLERFEFEPRSYFSTERIWQLAVFDHTGSERTFCFKIAMNHIRPIESAKSYDWRTEIPNSRLFGALEEGESLSSLYLRIDQPSSEADLLEDPLLRCLFARNACSYQEAQLRRIKAQL